MVSGNFLKSYFSISIRFDRPLETPGTNNLVEIFSRTFFWLKN
jgi:hypothetical protein